ncbi:MAG: sigma-70 family RNA polymerase sigma factor [Clostridia bacterium]|nr:sigma-70 family RNA polymerase sigma factor [Clostridia bacterium]MDE6676204.1 sigma-70 family RNA polymerase sigma factor [Clostridia bacterium]
MNDEELFAKFRETGDLEIRNQIVEKYLYIAAVLARKFVGRGVDYDDLYQIASLALIKGVSRFDETKGLQFSTFITPTITGEIKNYFRDRSRLIHLPRKVSELRVGLKKLSAQIFAETGRKPTAKELAERLGVTEEEVLRCSEAGGVVSLDRPAGSGEEGMSYHDVLPAEDVFEEVENRDAVESALLTLSDAERALVSYRFGQELSQVETAKRLGVSQMNVSRMERKVLQKLRETLSKSTVE